MLCRLTRINSVHRNLRTDEVEGDCFGRPVEGVPFNMTGAPLDPDSTIRIVQTTDVIETISSQDGLSIEFKTQNSTYLWEHFSTDLDSSGDRASVS